MSDKSKETNLDKILEILEDIKSILLLTNQDKIEGIKKTLLKEGSMEKQVYELCNSENTTEDISKTINKPNEYTRATVSSLRRKGLIKNVKRDGKKAFQQIV